MSWPEQVQALIDRIPGWALTMAAALAVAFMLEWGLRRSRRNGAAPDGPFDAFISYKSENVEFARRIAERLIASGLRVWFAEYQILLVGRDRFQEAIDQGIDRSRYGIAITNDLYAGSEHCRAEMARLLAQCSPDRILEIGLPAEPATHRLFPVLDHSPAMESTADPDAALGFVGERTGWRIDAGAGPGGSGPPQWHRGECLGLPYSVDVTGWTLVDPSFHGGGPCYGRREERLLWNLQYGAEFDPAVYDARRRWTGTRNNDRALLEAMCDYANHYFTDVLPARPVGVHLFFLDGAGHFAVSYRLGGSWKRRYSIMLVEPHSYKAAEFAFTFQYDGDFAGFCRAAEIMDRVAGSLRWGTPQDAEEKPALAPSQSAERIARVVDDLPAANKLFDEGMALLKQGQFVQGIARLERVLDYSNLAEMQGAVHFSIGLAHERSGNPDAAIRSYQAAAASNPRQFNALCNLGTVHYCRGDVRSALDAYLKAAEINPADYITVNNIVLCYQDLGDAEQAGAWRARWLALRP